MNFVDLINNPIEKKRKVLDHSRKNLIGVVFFSKKNKNIEKIIYNLVCEQTQPLDRLYVYFDLNDFPNHELDFDNSLSNILKGLGDIVNVQWGHDSLIFLKVLDYHKKDHCFIFKDMFYDVNTVKHALSMINPRSVINLSNDNSHKRRIYDNSILTYKKIENSPLYEQSIDRSPSYMNMVDYDVLIPANSDFNYRNSYNLRHEYFNDFQLWLWLECFKNEYTIYLNDLNTVNNFNLETEINLFKYLIKHPEFLKLWQEVFPGYKFNNSLKDDNFNMSNICNSKVDIAFISFNFPEMICQNLTQIENNCLFKINKIFLLANTNKPDLSISHFTKNKNIKKINWDKIDVFNNEEDQLFKRKMPYKFELEYGKDLYDQSVEYLKSKSEADYLIIFNDKIIIENLLIFNDDTDLKMGKYIKIINLKEKKEVKEFDSDQILLSPDFDRFASTIFRCCNIRMELVEKHLKNYNKVFNYDNNWSN